MSVLWSGVTKQNGRLSTTDYVLSNERVVVQLVQWVLPHLKHFLCCYRASQVWIGTQLVCG